MLEASCHCGAVKFQVPDAPAYVTDCNCSLCRRSGMRGAAYAPAQVRFICGEDATIPYIQGDATLATHHCAICGCITHARGLGELAQTWMKVNARMFDPQVTASWRIRQFDGADRWEFLD